MANLRGGRYYILSWCRERDAGCGQHIRLARYQPLWGAVAVMLSAMFVAFE